MHLFAAAYIGSKGNFGRTSRAIIFQKKGKIIYFFSELIFSRS